MGDSSQDGPEAQKVEGDEKSQKADKPIIHALLLNQVKSPSTQLPPSSTPRDASNQIIGLPQHHIKHLLLLMRLTERDAYSTYKRLFGWIETQAQKYTYQQTMFCTLLLQRLLQAYQHRPKTVELPAGRNRKASPSTRDDARQPLILSRTVSSKLLFVGSDLVRVLRLFRDSSTVSIEEVADNCLKVLRLEVLGQILAVAANSQFIPTIETTQKFYFFLNSAIATLMAQASSETKFVHEFVTVLQECTKSVYFQRLFAKVPRGVEEVWKIVCAKKLQHHVDASADHRLTILNTAGALSLFALLGACVCQECLDEEQTENNNKRITPSSIANDIVGVVIHSTNKMLSELKDPQRLRKISKEEIVHELSSLLCDIEQVPSVQQGTRKKGRSRGNPISELGFESVPDPQGIIDSITPIVSSMILRAQKNHFQLSLANNPIQALLFLVPFGIGESWEDGSPSPITTVKHYTKESTGSSFKDFGPPQLPIAALVQGPKTKAIHQQFTAKSLRHSSPRKSEDHNSNSDDEQQGSGRLGSYPKKLEDWINVKMLASEPSTEMSQKELSEWLHSFLTQSVVKPPSRLIGTNQRILGFQLLVPVLNRALRRIDGLNMSVNQWDGQVCAKGDPTSEVQLHTAVIGFFYFTFDCLLASGRLFLKKTNPHHLRALFVCCYCCIVKATLRLSALKLETKYHLLTIADLLDAFECNPRLFLEVAQSIGKILPGHNRWKMTDEQSPMIPGLPRDISSYLGDVETQILDSTIWISDLTGNSMAGAITKLATQPQSWPPEILGHHLSEELEDSTVSQQVREVSKPRYASPHVSRCAHFLGQILVLAHARIRFLCTMIHFPIHLSLSSSTMACFRFMLRHHIDLMYDRHMDQLILSCLFGTCKALEIQPDVTFSGLIECYLAMRGHEIGKVSCLQILQHVRLGDASDDHQTPNEGTLISFYNEVFVKRMKQYLLESKSLRRKREVYTAGHAMTKATPKVSSCLREADANRKRSFESMTPSQSNQPSP